MGIWGSIAPSSAAQGVIWGSLLVIWVDLGVICGDSGVIWSSVFVIWGDLGVICGDSGDSGFLGGLPWGSFGLSPGGPSGRFFRDPFESSNPLSTLNPNLQLARLTTLSR